MSFYMYFVERKMDSCISHGTGDRRSRGRIHTRSWSDWQPQSLASWHHNLVTLLPVPAQSEPSDVVITFHQSPKDDRYTHHSQPPVTIPLTPLIQKLLQMQRSSWLVKWPITISIKFSQFYKKIIFCASTLFNSEKCYDLFSFRAIMC